MTFAISHGNAFAQPSDPPVRPKAKLIQLKWNLQKGATLYQGITVVIKPSCRVQGIALQSHAQYSILSRLTVQKRNDDGSLVVSQKVIATKLDKADDLLRQALGGMVRKLNGRSCTVHLSPSMQVTKLEGFKDDLKVMPAKDFAGGQGFLMGSLIDRDGWKELMQATFFIPERPLRMGETWGRALTHSWGALGSWSGMALYAYEGNRDDLHKISYALKLKHVPPKKAPAALPFRINDAVFVPKLAGGNVIFDAAKGRVVAAEERFLVTGKVTVNLLGQNVAVELQEDQLFSIRLTEKNPLERAKVPIRDPR